MTYRWSSLGLGGRIEVHVDAPDGPLISDTGMILPTGDDQVYQDVTAPISDPGGTHKLYFVFKNVPLVPRLFNINWIDFNGVGISAVDVDSTESTTSSTTARSSRTTRPTAAASTPPCPTGSAMRASAATSPATGP